jgi:HK97 family phage portal protein
MANIFSRWFNGRDLANRATLLMSVHNLEVVPHIGVESAISEGFNGNTAWYTITKKDANKFASFPMYVMDVKNFEKAKKLTGGRADRLEKLLQQPNRNEGQAAFLKKIRAYFKTCGEAFIELNRGDLNETNNTKLALMEVVEMHVLPAQHMTILPASDNVWGVAGYMLSYNGRKRFIPEANVIHWKDINLNFDSVTRDHLRGMSPLTPGKETLTANQDAERATVRMMQNDGTKAVIYGKDPAGSYTPDQESEIRSVIENRTNGAGNKGRTASIFGAGELGVIDLSRSSQDMQLRENKKQTWQDMCALADIPYLLFDPEATYANLSEAKKNWVNDTIIPARRELDDELNRKLLRSFALEGVASIYSDPSELPELQEDMKLLTEWMKDSDELTPNEKREAKGFEKYEDPLMDEPWVGGKPISEHTDDGFDQLAGELGLSDYRSNGDAAVPGDTRRENVPPRKADA